MNYHWDYFLIAFIFCLIGIGIGLFIDRKYLKMYWKEKKKLIKANLNFIHEKDRADKAEYLLNEHRKASKNLSDLLR